MIDLGTSTSVMLKQVENALKLRYEPLGKGIMQLDIQEDPNCWLD